MCLKIVAFVFNHLQCAYSAAASHLVAQITSYSRLQTLSHPSFHKTG